MVSSPGYMRQRKYKERYPERVKANNDHFAKLKIHCDACNTSLLYTSKARHVVGAKHIANAQKLANENNI
jgi:hypothetical protein